MSTEEEKIKLLSDCVSLRRSLLDAPYKRIKEELDYSFLTQTDLQEQLELSKSDLKKLLNGQVPIRLELAKRLQEIFIVEAREWLELEQRYQYELFEIDKMQAEIDRLQVTVNLKKGLKSKA